MDADNVNMFGNYEIMSKHIASLIYDKGKEIIKGKGVFLFSVAGGKSPIGLYRELAKIARNDKKFWENTKIYWTDERYVPYENEFSNFKMVKETLLSNVPVKEDNIHPIPTHYKDPYQSADVYAEIFPQYIDIMLLGMGTDGHIASIFPNGRAISEKEKRFTVDFAPAEPKVRITATLPTLKSANKIIMVVAGKGKTKLLDKIFKATGPLEELPARAVRDAIWFVSSDDPA